MHAMALLIRHYTLPQRETPGLVDITLPNKNFKKICYGCSPIEIFNPKQAGPMSSMFTQH